MTEKIVQTQIIEGGTKVKILLADSKSEVYYTFLASDIVEMANCEFCQHGED